MVRVISSRDLQDQDGHSFYDTSVDGLYSSPSEMTEEPMSSEASVEKPTPDARRTSVVDLSNLGESLT